MQWWMDSFHSGESQDLRIFCPICLLVSWQSQHHRIPSSIPKDSQPYREICAVQSIQAESVWILLSQCCFIVLWTVVGSRSSHTPFQGISQVQARKKKKISVTQLGQGQNGTHTQISVCSVRKQRAPRYVWFILILFRKKFIGQTPCGILVPQLGMESMLPAVKVQSLNHWTAREVLRCV